MKRGCRVLWTEALLGCASTLWLLCNSAVAYAQGAPRDAGHQGDLLRPKECQARQAYFPGHGSGIAGCTGSVAFKIIKTQQGFMTEATGAYEVGGRRYEFVEAPSAKTRAFGSEDLIAVERAIIAVDGVSKGSASKDGLATGTLRMLFTRAGQPVRVTTRLQDGSGGTVQFTDDPRWVPVVPSDTLDALLEQSTETVDGLPSGAEPPMPPTQPGGGSGSPEEPPAVPPTEGGGDDPVMDPGFNECNLGHFCCVVTSGVAPFETSVLLPVHQVYKEGSGKAPTECVLDPNVVCCELQEIAPTGLLGCPENGTPVMTAQAKWVYNGMQGPKTTVRPPKQKEVAKFTMNACNTRYGMENTVEFVSQSVDINIAMSTVTGLSEADGESNDIAPFELDLNGKIKVDDSITDVTATLHRKVEGCDGMKERWVGTQTTTLDEYEFGGKEICEIYREQKGSTTVRVARFETGMVNPVQFGSAVLETTRTEDWEGTGVGGCEHGQYGCSDGEPTCDNMLAYKKGKVCQGPKPPPGPPGGPRLPPNTYRGGDPGSPIKRVGDLMDGTRGGGDR